MQTSRNCSSRGFSLIELVIVVVIIGIIAAIAIPRLSRGSANAGDAALSGNLAVLRNAIDLYATEHNHTFPSAEKFNEQLTMYSDESGNTAAEKDGTHIYGPYLRKVPPLPVGPSGRKGSTAIADSSAGLVGVPDGGWYYSATTGDIKANLLDTAVDRSALPYNKY